MPAIGKAISAYQKLQMDMIGKLSSSGENVLEEVPFYDEGYIFTQIERLKREHENVSRDLKIAIELNAQSDCELQKRIQLKAKLDRIEVKMMYYAINSFRSLRLCKALVNGKDIKIVGLIQALEYYHEGNLAQAEEMFYRYFKENCVESAFYLGNKIYGKLLLNKGNTEEALLHLEHAAQMKVNDKELLMMLQNAYQVMQKELEKSIVDEICQILG